MSFNKRKGKSQASSAIWTAATTGLGAVLQLVQLMVAARYLDAHEFGALAIVNIIGWVVISFQDMGLSSFCIYAGEVSRRSHSTLFWISTGLGSLMLFLVMLIATPVSDFYNIAELGYLLPLLSLNFFLIGMGAQYQANLIRTFQAERLAKIELASRMIGFFITIKFLIFNDMGAQSVVIGLISFSLCKLIMMWKSAEAHWHPSWAFDSSLAPRAFRYGVFQAASQVVNQLRTQADQIILGKALGAEWLGIYSLAKEIINYPLRFLQPLLSRLTLPYLARNQDSFSILSHSFLLTLNRTAIASTLMYMALLLSAPWIINIIYGEKFSAVLSLIPLLIVFGALRPLGLNIGMLAQAIGRTSNELLWNLVAATISLPAGLMVAFFWPTVEAFAISASVVQVALCALSYPYFLKPLLPIGAKLYFSVWGGALLAMISGCFFVKYINIYSFKFL